MPTTYKEKIQLLLLIISFICDVYTHPIVNMDLLTALEASASPEAPITPSTKQLTHDQH